MGDLPQCLKDVGQRPPQTNRVQVIPDDRPPPALILGDGLHKVWSGCGCLPEDHRRRAKMWSTPNQMQRVAQPQVYPGRGGWIPDFAGMTMPALPSNISGAASPLLSIPVGLPSPLIDTARQYSGWLLYILVPRFHTLRPISASN